MNGASGGADRLPPIASPRVPARTALALGALCLVFAALAAVDLANVRPVSGDDVLILTVSAHLAETGVLGSPLHHGVFSADEHYFLNLPLQHVLHAAVFRAFGEGVAQARLVSVAAAIAVLCASTLIALRWFGARVAAGTALLLVVWRSGVIGLDFGLPLLAAARTARYDITAVALLWLALLAFDSHMRRPGRTRAFTAGVLAGAAMLTQFHGALVLPAVAALWLGNRGAAERRSGLLWLACGLVLALAPYVVYFASHGADALAQIRLVHGPRISDGPAGLLSSIVAEPLRFSAAATQRGIGQFGVLLALGVTGAIALRKTTAHPEAGARNAIRRLLLVTTAMVIALGLFEPTKAALYALPLVPALCMLLAVALDALWRWERRSDGTRPGAARAAALVLGALLVAEGAAALTRDRIAAAGVTAYADLAAEIAGAMPAGAGVLGPAQWSWGLRAHPYAEVRAVALRQRAPAIAGRSVQLTAMVREQRVRYVVLNDDVRGELRRGFYGEPFGAELRSFLGKCTSPVRVWNDATYGGVELRIVVPACSAG